MEYRKKPDYAETAYREAVSRLRVLLAESYTVRKSGRDLDSAGEDTDNQSLLSGTSRYSKRYLNDNYTIPKRFYPIDNLSKYNFLRNEPTLERQKHENTSIPPELMSFIERQEDYIEQLEKESKFCREELSLLFAKVKDLINENETLHERQKSNIIKSVFDHLELETETETENETTNKISSSPKKVRKQYTHEGPNILYESRISELEAQLTQTKIDLKKALENGHEKKLAENFGDLEFYKKQIDHLQKENRTFQETIEKLQDFISRLEDKENDTSGQVKRSLDVAEQAQYEKNAADLEIRRLKDELERQHGKLRDSIAEQSRRIAEERTAVERRYTQQIEQLTAELGVQWETTNKLQLELDKQRRENTDLRRDLAQKNSLIDELRKELNSKIASFQSDIGTSSAEKSSLEQQIAGLQMTNERNERQSKQEINRLQNEMQSLRQRLDRADADLIHSRRENLRLNEQIASLEKEINLDKALGEERSKRQPTTTDLVAPKDNREKDMQTMIENLESKHALTVAELEGMIRSQNQLMDKLSNECHTLTQKLDEASKRHKEEIRKLQTSLENLNDKFNQSQNVPSDDKDSHYAPISNQHVNQQESTHYYTNPATLSRQNSKEHSSMRAAYNTETVSNEYEQYAPVESQEQQEYQDYLNQKQAYGQGDYNPDGTQPYLTQEEYEQQYQYQANPEQQYDLMPEEQYEEDTKPASDAIENE